MWISILINIQDALFLHKLWLFNAYVMLTHHVSLMYLQKADIYNDVDIACWLRQVTLNNLCIFCCLYFTGLDMVCGMQSFLHYFSRLADIKISIRYNCSELHHLNSWRVNKTGQFSHAPSTLGAYKYPFLVANQWLKSTACLHSHVTLNMLTHKIMQVMAFS